MSQFPFFVFIPYQELLWELWYVKSVPLTYLHCIWYSSKCQYDYSANLIHSVGVFSCTTRRHWTLPEGCAVVLEDFLFWWWALLRPTPPTKKKRSRLDGRTQSMFSFGARLAPIRFEVHTHNSSRGSSPRCVPEHNGVSLPFSISSLVLL